MFTERDEVIQVAIIENKHRVHDPNGLNIPINRNNQLPDEIAAEMLRLCLDKNLSNDEKKKQYDAFVDKFNETYNMKF